MNTSNPKLQTYYEVFAQVTGKQIFLSFQNESEEKLLKEVLDHVTALLSMGQIVTIVKGVEIV